MPASAAATCASKVTYAGRISGQIEGTGGGETVGAGVRMTGKKKYVAITMDLSRNASAWYIPDTVGSESSPSSTRF